MDVTFAQSLAAFVSAGLGTALAVSIGVSHRQLCALISFAAGALLSASFFHILPEAWASGISWISLFVALASGYGLFYLISRYVSHVCPACAASHFEHHQGPELKNMLRLLVIALSVHMLVDGIALALGAKTAGQQDHSVFFTIAIHKLPEGLALCAVFLKSGYSKRKALIASLVFESVTILGWRLGHEMLVRDFELWWLDLVMVHIAGGFIYLALHAVINEIKDHSPRLILTFFLIGFLFMALVR